jgi:hypothetical protein
MRTLALARGLVFNRGRRLSEGTLVEAYVRGRVLGIPLLKIDALVALVPASPEPVVQSTSRAAPSVGPLLSRRNGSTKLKAPGSALAEAVRSIDEAGALLAETRRNGSG